MAALEQTKTIWTLAVLAVILQAACGVTVIGQAFCDKCWEGGYSCDTDTYIDERDVTINCTVGIDVSGTHTAKYFWASGRTQHDGSFSARIVGVTDNFGELEAGDAFMKALFVNKDIRQGTLPGASLLGCYVMVVDPPSYCSVIGLNDGVCLPGGSMGNGWTGSNFNLVPVDTTFANILLGPGGSVSNSICYKPSSKNASCSTTHPGEEGDPHFTGADGSRFDFSGEPNASFCLVSDSHLHINAFYGGRYGQWGDNPHKALTWIRQLAILWGHHTIVLAAREGAIWQYQGGYMSRMEVDGDLVTLNQAGDQAVFAGGAIELQWLSAKGRSGDAGEDIYEVKVGGVLTLRVTLKPEIELLRTKDDGVVHINLELPEVDISQNAHGVLGQTFREDHKGRLAEQSLVYSQLLDAQVVPGDNAEGFLDGSPADYRTSGLLRADCRVARFIRASRRDLESARAIELAASSTTSSTGLGQRMIRTRVAGSLSSSSSSTSTSTSASS